MFNGAEKFNQPLNSWDSSNVVNMEYMFRLAREFNQDLRSWDVSKVTNHYNMFLFAEKFKQDFVFFDKEYYDSRPYEPYEPYDPYAEKYLDMLYGMATVTMKCEDFYQSLNEFNSTSSETE